MPWILCMSQFCSLAMSPNYSITFYRAIGKTASVASCFHPLRYLKQQFKYKPTRSIFGCYNPDGWTKQIHSLSLWLIRDNVQDAGVVRVGGWTGRECFYAWRYNSTAQLSQSTSCGIGRLGQPLARVWRWFNDGRNWGSGTRCRGANATHGPPNFSWRPVRCGRTAISASWKGACNRES